MNLVKCRFLSEDKTPKGREYTYAAIENLSQGEIVTTQDGKEVVITAVDVPSETIAGFESKLKFVARASGTEANEVLSDVIDMPFDSAEPPVESVLATELPEISVNKENLAIVEQLPIITERLKVFSTEIDNIAVAVESMECTEENRQIVKKHRQKINALLIEFEKRRMTIKNEILAPYENFNSDYKTYVSDKIANALKILDSRIAVIENDMKQRLRDDAEGYFYECLTCKNIDWLAWEQSGIKVGLSDNKTALRREVDKFVNKVSDDLALIETQESKAEITVEYRKDLNLAKAISTVQARIKAIAEQERLRAEREEQKKKQEEQRRLQAEAMEKAIRSGSTTTRPSDTPASRTSTVCSSPFDPPITTSTEPTVQPDAKKYSIAFKIVNETPERLALVKKYLTDNGFVYAQIPLKNIVVEG